MSEEALLIFARKPALGQGKTRLAAGIGPEAALAVYRELLAATHAAVAAAGVPATVWLAGAEPADNQEETQPEWPGLPWQPQPAGDLGQRMATAFAGAFAAGATRVAIIGTDCPELNASHLQAAFGALRTHEVVLGPAADGGYYLLGMSPALCPALLEGKPWSTSTVLAATLADAHRLGLRVKLLPKLHDVDDANDLAAWRGRTYTGR